MKYSSRKLQTCLYSIHCRTWSKLVRVGLLVRVSVVSYSNTEEPRRAIVGA